MERYLPAPIALVIAYIRNLQKTYSCAPTPDPLRTPDYCIQHHRVRRAWDLPGPHIPPLLRTDTDTESLWQKTNTKEKTM